MNESEWNLSPSEAVRLQKELRQKVRIEPLSREVRFIAGCDISFSKFTDVIYAGIVVLELPDLSVVDMASIETVTSFPYIPGLLSFRETPPLLDVWSRLKVKPDAVMMDGAGYAHPRRFGYACHFGLITGVPSIGCAKTVLVGKYEEPGEEQGSCSWLVDKGEIVGAALRTKTRVAPVYISAGHLIDLDGSIRLTMQSMRIASSRKEAARSKYRIPEPTRLAHILVNARRRGEDLEKAVSSAAG